MLGAEPQVPPAPTDAELCAEAASDTTALVPGLLSRLDYADLDALDGESAVDAAVAFDRVANRVAARRVRAVAVAARRHVGTERIDPIRLAAAELGAALRLGSRSVSVEVGVALELTGRLARTLSAMESGGVSYGKAKLLVDETIDLLDEHAHAVENHVLGKAAERTYAQHAAAVRRAVVRVDPTAPARRRNAAERASRLMRHYAADGLAELIVRLPVAQVDAAYTAADAWARARKAQGDDRTLEVLRAHAIARWATSYLTHGDPTVCDTICDPVASPTPSPAPAEADATPEPPPAAAPVSATSRRRTPMRHGRPVRVGLVWDLASLLGLADEPGELLDSGEVIAAADMRALAAGGIRLRRMLIDPDTGELVDLTPGSWLLKPEPGHQPTRTDRPGHGAPMWLGIILDTTTWQAWRENTLRGYLGTAIALAPQPIRDLLDAPRTDHTLDTNPTGDTPSAALAEFVALRDRHPTNPTAAPTAAAAGDTDHIRPRSQAGPTTRANLHTPTRRWHLLRTHGGWTLTKHRDTGCTWTSPHGRRYRTHPHDYRRGP